MSANSMDWKEEIIENRLGGKRDWTEQERIELCHQLDKESEDNFKNIPKCSGIDRWTEENWKENMAEHPLFAGFLQEDGENLIAPDNPLCDGIAQLKFHPDHCTPDEIAVNYKDDGNIYYKAKKYSLGIISYTEGLKQNITVDDLSAQIYNNRATCHFSLGQYRKALNDSVKAVELIPSYTKAIKRAATCCLKLKLYEDCYSWCDKGMKMDSLEDMVVLRKEAEKEETEEKARQRRNALAAKKNYRKNEILLKRLKDRKMEFFNSFIHCNDTVELMDNLSNARVKISTDGDLEWDVAFLYPEYSESDLVEQFNEHTRLITQLELMFNPPPPPWDLQHNYKIDKIHLYFADTNTGRPRPVDITSTLANVLKKNEYPISNLFPTFLVVSEAFKEQFLAKCLR